MIKQHIQYWIFDLDNTLYPYHCCLFDQIDDKMQEFIINHLDINGDDAKKLQKQYYHDYGTTLRGLMEHHHVTPDDFLSFVHDIDYSILQADNALSQALSSLNGQKFIYTNGSTQHAINVLEKLGLRHHFDHIFDIKDSDYIPKPQQYGYDKMIKKFAIGPQKAIMFEDIPRNLKIPHQLGIRTALIINAENQATNYPDYIDYMINDLSSWLEDL